MSQFFEIFKMQYLVKFLDGSSTNTSQFLTMIILLMYDQISKYIPTLFEFLLTFFNYYTKNNDKNDNKHDKNDIYSSTNVQISRQEKAYIQFERSEDKSNDIRIDSVLHHVCNLPLVKSLRYNGVEMIPNFKDMLMIENDIWFKMCQEPINLNNSNSNKKVDSMIYRLSTYDHDITWIHKFVDETIERYEQDKKNKLGNETYYFDHITNDNKCFTNPVSRVFTVFTKSKFTTNRNLNNVYFRQIDELKQRVDFFMKRRDWYDMKGIPHTLGIVMYGSPGGGKTSTIKGIANETKRHIFNISLSEIKTREELKELFYNDKVHVVIDNRLEILNIPIKNRLYVIEDIDTMKSVVTKRSAKENEITNNDIIDIDKSDLAFPYINKIEKNDKKEIKDKLDLATLLNILDGVRETPGRAIILSTNYPERLDEALLRPGRFDMMIEFERHSCEVLKQHIEKYYDIKLTSKQLEKIKNPSIDKKWTGAEVSQILFRRISNVDLAIDDLTNEDPSKLFKFSYFINKEDINVNKKNSVTYLNMDFSNDDDELFVEKNIGNKENTEIPIINEKQFKPLEDNDINPKNKINNFYLTNEFDNLTNDFKSKN